MGISLKPEYLKRYRDIAWFVLKYGNSDLVSQAGLEKALPDEAPDEISDDLAEELSRDLERMGPTFIKLGQLLSTRADLLPPSYMAALSRLQDNVAPFPAEEAMRIFEDEIGVRISKAFQDFDAEPMAAASLGQVHRATLRDGRMVAVKIQRPGIRKTISSDLEALQEIAEFLDTRTELGRQYEFTRILDEFRKTIYIELDYNEEAKHLKALRENLADFEQILVPDALADFTASRVLTMEYVAGKKITSLSPLGRIEIEGRPLAETILEAYLKQILVDGFFHADPHPGNVFITHDHRIALLDLGMVARVSPRLQENLLKFLLAVSEGRGEEAAEVAQEIGDPQDHFQHRQFERKIADIVNRYHGASIGELQVGTIVLEVTAIAAESGIRVPPELTMLGKTLLNLDEVARTLDPTFDPNETVKRKAASILNRRLLKSLSPNRMVSGALEMKQFFDALPGRANKILDRLANNEMEIQVNAIDEEQLTQGFQKVANRISAGLVLAAFIIGASMLMHVETEFTILGYPGFAIICFTIAIIGGIILLVDVALHDRRQRSRSR